MTETLTASAGVIAVFMVAMWVLSLILRDASIVDIGWGIGFALVAAVAGVLGEGDAGRRGLLFVVVAVWGLRLALHLWHRQVGKPEDFRYRLMRKRHGDRFAVVSAFTVFGLQGALMWIVALPVQLAAAADSPKLGAVAVVGVIISVFGFVFEAVADNQLRRFGTDPANHDRVLDTGLWRYTRHPNYFGDCCVWWGIWLIAAETPAGRYGIIAPILMTVLLTRVSGVPMLEHSMAKRRPGYSGYVERTSRFFPRPPRPS